MSILDKFRKNDGEDRQDQTRKIKTVTREGGKAGGNLGRRFLRRILSRYRGAFTRRTTPPHMALAVATTSFKIAIAFLVVLCFVVGGFTIVASSVLQALGKGFWSMSIAIFRQLLLVLPMAFLFSKIGGLSMVWWSFPIAEVLAGLLAAYYLWRIYQKVIRPLAEKDYKF